MPWFRERGFPGVHGRLRSQPPVDTGQARYTSGAGEHSPDWALRWSHVVGDWDVGLSHFSGTSRDPVFDLGVNGAGESVLIPIYHHIDQSGLDLQLVADDTLWKLELIRRSGHGESFTAATGGFEHTFYSAMDTNADLGLLVEYLYNNKMDSRVIVFENDLFIGMRLMMNDMQDTQMLFGIIRDLDDTGMMVNLEASRRLGESWRLNLEARFFTGLKSEDPQWSVRRDDYVQLELSRYF